MANDKIIVKIRDESPIKINLNEGIKGDQGDQGIQGIKGNTGSQGIQGEKGDKGDKGDTGVSTWDEIEGKPESTPEEIDDAVDKKHEHANKVILDSIGFDESYKTFMISKS